MRTPRRPLTPKAKAALWQAQDKRCAKCSDPVELAHVEWDHKHSLWCGGGNEPENFQGICGDCHTAKTRRESGARGKMKRLAKGPRQRKGRRLQGRGFGPSRGFDTRLRKKVRGQVEVRT